MLGRVWGQWGLPFRGTGSDDSEKTTYFSVMKVAAAVPQAAVIAGGGAVWEGVTCGCGVGGVTQAEVAGHHLSQLHVSHSRIPCWVARGAGCGWVARGGGGGAGGCGVGTEEVEAELYDQKTPAHMMIVQKSIKLIPLPNKQEMVSHVVKPKSSRTPRQSPQASAAARQRGRVGLTKGAWEQAESGRQELEANLSGLFVKLGVEK